MWDIWLCWWYGQSTHGFTRGSCPPPILHDQLVALVETMLQLNKDLQAAALPEQKEQLKARIDYTDKKIDKLVYELYGLTEEEIRIVEGEV